MYTYYQQIGIIYNTPQPCLLQQPYNRLIVYLSPLALIKRWTSLDFSSGINLNLNSEHKFTSADHLVLVLRQCVPTTLSSSGDYAESAFSRLYHQPAIIPPQSRCLTASQWLGNQAV